MVSVTKSCAVRLEHETSERWVELALALPARQSDFDEFRFLVYPSQFACDVAGLDELASSYTLENWESGVLSGLVYAFRRRKRPPRGVVVAEMRGRLRSEDMPAVALASAIGVTRLLDGDVADLSLPEWEVRFEWREGLSRPALMSARSA